MEWKSLKKQVLSPFEIFFYRENYTGINILSILTIVYSISLIAIGFFSGVYNFYIGDNLLRIFLFILTSLLLIQCLYAYVKMNIRFKLISMILFTTLLLLLSLYLPTLPPAYDLRAYEMSASLVKFLIISLLLIIIGIFSIKFSFNLIYGFGRKSKQYSAYFVLIFSVLIVLYPLIIIVGNIIMNGVGGITWEFLTQDVSRHGAEGGIVKNIIGTISLIIGVAVVTLPLGIGAAVYLTEYAKGGFIVRIIRIAVDILQGVPSIVFGLFAYALLVSIFGFCLLNGILVLTFLTLPIIIRTSEEAILSGNP